MTSCYDCGSSLGVSSKGRKPTGKEGGISVKVDGKLRELCTECVEEH